MTPQHLFYSSAQVERLTDSLRQQLADMTTACEGWCKVAEKAEVDRDAARDLLMDARAYYDRYMENRASLHKPKWYVESSR